MGCIEGLLRWIAMERHTTDFYRLLTEGDAHFKACPSICNTNND
uniref:Uncharacterized protein n=1 Tax=Romanomermis culicivorax TaxID=13658 RepID=A0A915ILC8_ROMCU